MNTSEGTTTITAAGAGGSEKRKSSNDDEHTHGRKKRRPSTYVEGKNKYTAIDPNRYIKTNKSNQQSNR